jgi:hypothetical protein
MTEKQTYHEHRMEATFCWADKEDILLRHLLVKGSSLTAYAGNMRGFGGICKYDFADF